MLKCAECGKQFDPLDAEDEYEAEFPDLVYSEDVDGTSAGSAPWRKPRATWT